MGVVASSFADVARPMMVHGLSRYMAKGIVTGPTGGMAEDLVRVVNGLKGGDLKDSDINAIARLMPLGTLPVLRSIVEYGLKPAAKSAVAD